jgi:exopolyphosphatase / guanosine-5'-triphosphate,3'-diphosphate pyrophosphatase
MMARLAAIDVGTNSVRLLVAEPADPPVHVERLMEVTRLGAGVDASGRLDDAALGRTLDTIERFATRARALGASALRVAATSAVRDAADRERFFAGVRERAGVDVDVLSGLREAATAFRGATAAVAGAGPFLVLDIGGGSTELVLGDREPLAAASQQLGCVRLTERCLRSDPPTAAELGAAITVIDAALDEAAATIRAAGDGESALDPAAARTLVGVAGTVTTLGALHLGLERYEPERIHGTRVSRARVRELRAWLAAMPARARAELGPMAPGREDVIVGGALILERAMLRFGFETVLVSEADILDGLVAELAARRPD